MNLASNVSKLKAKYAGWRQEPLARVNEHERIVERACVAEASSETIDHALESAFYGESRSLAIKQDRADFCTLKDVWVVGKQGYVYFDANTLFDTGPLLASVRDEKLWRPVPRLSQTVEEPVFHLIGRNATNRAHFLVEQLPRLIASIRCVAPNDDYKILLSPGAAAWQMQWLAKLGIPTSRCMEAGKGSTLFRTLYYTPPLMSSRENRMCAPSHYTHLRDAVLARNRAGTSNVQPAVFISRKDASVRRLLNEDDVFDTCAAFFPGLRRVSLEGLSLDEQLQLFSSAPVILGPHGQPFRYNLFAHQATIVQLSDGSKDGDFDNKAWADIFTSLAQLSENRAMTLYTGSATAGTTADWTYPISLLQEQLTKLVGML